jgi:mRNA-degrading endonuclease HigB of HigAB toxin-antitoxin module
MRIVTTTRLDAFGNAHPPAASVLAKWQVVVKAAHWRSPEDVKRTFKNADWVAPLWVFDISRNRIVAYVQYEYTYINVEQGFEVQKTAQGIVFIKGVYTHPEYDKLDIASLDSKKGAAA